MKTDSFNLLCKDESTSARAGVLETAHGDLKTPAFMPVGTAGAVKGIIPELIHRSGTEIILANTYHIFIRPGVDIVEKLGGLHRFMGWDNPILTDSGGYQVFSLTDLNKVNDDGVEFSSHVDGKKIHLSPESATEIQNRLGADIIMCFDECAPYPCEQSRLEETVERTIKWAKKCKDEHNRDEQLLFGITQGGIDTRLREYCTKALVDMDFSGYALGGLSVGEGHQNMIETVASSTPLLPENKARYLMGVGTPADIIAAVREGIDMFDCVMPTRNGRNAYAFTENGAVRMRNSTHSDSSEPVEPGCDCYACRNYTRAAIRHFFNVSEMLGPVLVAVHNINFYQRLMQNIRRKIKKGEFGEWSEQKLLQYKVFNK
jgi:queuine tRNA-ribosyltransferase